MFEKEAKEKAEEIEAKLILGVYDNDEDLARDEGWNDGYVNGYEEGFRDGAEFSYNKANEWHYIKAGDFPSPNIRVDVWVKLSKNYETKYIAYWRPTIKKWQIYNLIEASRQFKDEDFLNENEVIAWKEIVPPKEEKPC